MAEPIFNVNESVEYRLAGAGPFIGEAPMVEVLQDGHGAPFPREASIFAEEQLRLKPPEAVGSV